MEADLTQNLLDLPTSMLVRSFSLHTQVSFTSKADSHDITVILLKVVSNIHNPTPTY